MPATPITPYPSPITRLGLVRIVRTNLLSAQAYASSMGLTIDQIYGCDSPRHLEVSCRHLGPKGNHEPRWNEAQRMAFDMAVNGV